MFRLDQFLRLSSLKSAIFIRMKKIIFGSLAGIATSFVVNMGIVMIAMFTGTEAFRSVDPNDAEAFIEAMNSMTAADYMWPLAAHFLGIFSGLLVARILCKTSRAPLYIVVGFHMLATILNLMQIPHPTWFAVVDVMGALAIAFAFLSLKKQKN